MLANNISKRIVRQKTIVERMGENGSYDFSQGNIIKNNPCSSDGRGEGRLSCILKSNFVLHCYFHKE